MTTLILEYPREDAITIVKAAFERTSGVKHYHDDGHRIIGKSGMSLGSYGEKIVVEIPENQSNEDETMISVNAEREVQVNITSNPDKYKSRFLAELETLREHDVDYILQKMSEQMRPEDSKEVTVSGDLGDGASRLLIVGILVTVLFLLFMLFMMASLTP